MSRKPKQTNTYTIMTTAAHTDPVLKRIHANPQSKGGLGKSFETEARVAWLDSHGISWRGSDLDDRHRTFGDKHPHDVHIYKMGSDMEAKEVFQTIFRGILQQQEDVHVIDTRAQMDELFTTSVEDYSLLELCREKGIRMTQFMFPSDEMASMLNFTDLVRFGAGTVDFVVVENPARTKGKLFRGSRLDRTMQELGAQIITLPTIIYSTLRAMEIAENKAGRGIPLAEFAADEAGHLDAFRRREIQSFLGKMYAQYNCIADLLLPTSHAATIQATAKPFIDKKGPRAGSDGYQLNFNE